MDLAQDTELLVHGFFDSGEHICSLFCEILCKICKFF